MRLTFCIACLHNLIYMIFTMKILNLGPFLPCNDLFDWWTLRCGVWIVFLLALMGNGTVVFVLIFARTKMDVPRFLVRMTYLKSIKITANLFLQGLFMSHLFIFMTGL